MTSKEILNINYIIDATSIYHEYERGGKELELERGREKVGYDFFCDFVATLRRYHDIMTRILSVLSII